MKLVPPSAKGAHPYRKACRSRGIKVAAPPLDSHCDRPVTYPGDNKILIKSSKGRSGPTLNTIFIITHIKIPYVTAVKQVSDFKTPIILYLIKL
jgi:hypothetical protein